MIQKSVLKDALEIQRRFQSALPFRHAAIKDFLEPQVAECLLSDFPAFDRKYAMNEMGEVGLKAVVKRAARISPSYKTFCDYINSQPFLNPMSELTGIPDLIADSTLFGGGTHENRGGQHLDTRVDFNMDERRMLHRRLNLLVYLNKDWNDSWGGAIELHSNPRTPDCNEVKSFSPIFNRAVMFETN